MAQIPITQLEKYLLSLIDTSNLLEVQRVHRYMALERNRRKLQTLLNRNGVKDAVENKHQKYAKPHFALKEIRDIEKELKTIEDSLLKKQKTPVQISGRKPLINA